VAEGKKVRIRVRTVSCAYVGEFLIPPMRHRVSDAINEDTRLFISLTDVVIDDKATKVWDHSISKWAVWISPNPDLEQSARRAALVDVELAAKQMDILSNAQATAELALRDFLRLAGHSNVNFRVVD